MKFHNVNLFNKPILQSNEVYFSLQFVSLISPQVMVNLRLFFIKNLSKRLILKQSYIVMTWFYYLNFVNSNKSTRCCNFFSLPTKQKHYTILKAPIAHKNWSKEQIKFKFYFLVASFSSNLTENFSLKQINAALLFAMISKQKFPFFETNLLFLKSSIITFFVTDSLFFNYYERTKKV